MVTKQLHRCGLYLGNSEDMLAPSLDNPDGYWEHVAFVEINEALLQHLGAAWDDPFALSTADLVAAARIELGSKGRALCERLARNAVWGWKDPRNSVTLPFWQEVTADLKVIICIRNPLEVVLSLRKRGFPSVSKALTLWAAYTTRALDAVPRAKRMLTHYDAYFTRPLIELKRVVEFAGLPASDEILRAEADPNKSLRHSWLRGQHLKHARVPSHILDLYEAVCAESDWKDPIVARTPTALHHAQSPRPDAQGGPRGDELADLRQARQEGSTPVGVEILRLELESESLRTRLEARDAVVVQLQANYRATMSDLAATQSAVERQGRELDELRVSIKILTEVASEVLPRWAPEMQKKAEYLRSIERLRRVVETTLSRHAAVLVVSKGDDALLELHGRVASHFPQSEAGTYSGNHPSCSLSAIGQLEGLRDRGAQFLAFPETSLWWLDHYLGFRKHLQSRYRQVTCQESACSIYSLTDTLSVDHHSSVPGAFQNLLARRRERSGEDPAILDWNTGIDLCGELPDLSVFSPPDEAAVLPYFDGSVDIVAIRSGNADRHAEACRVASAAIVIFPDPSDNSSSRNGVRVEWLKEWESNEVSTPGATIVVLDETVMGDSKPWMRSLRASLPNDFPGNIISASAVTTVSRDTLTRASNGQGKAVLPSQQMPGKTAQLAAQAASEGSNDVLIFLNGRVVPLADWLPPLLASFQRSDRTGIVAGRLVRGDGRLHSAGGVIFADASVVGFGEGDWDPEAPFFEFVRQVDCCVGPFLATRRSLFDELQGFDAGFQCSNFQFADYCLRARELGYLTIYQPETHIVCLSVPKSATDLQDSETASAHGDKKRFREKWIGKLRTQPVSPPSFDREAWHALAAHAACDGVPQS